MREDKIINFILGDPPRLTDSIHAAIVFSLPIVVHHISFKVKVGERERFPTLFRFVSGDIDLKSDIWNMTVIRGSSRFYVKYINGHLGILSAKPNDTILFAFLFQCVIQ